MRFKPCLRFDKLICTVYIGYRWIVTFFNDNKYTWRHYHHTIRILSKAAVVIVFCMQNRQSNELTKARQLANAPTHQLTNPITHQLINSSTHKFINSKLTSSSTPNSQVHQLQTHKLQTHQLQTHKLTNSKLTNPSTPNSLIHQLTNSSTQILNRYLLFYNTALIFAPF